MSINTCPTVYCGIFRWFIPGVCDYSITINKVGKSKHNKTLLRYKESKDRHVSALIFYKAIIRYDMENFSVLCTYVLCNIVIHP